MWRGELDHLNFFRFVRDMCVYTYVCRVYAPSTCQIIYRGQVHVREERKGKFESYVPPSSKSTALLSDADFAECFT